ncbi:hypothetical protein GCM10020218_084930 [Dactylosporangium vinaceum]
MFRQKGARPTRWVAVALLATCGVLAVPQTSFAAAAGPAHAAAKSRTHAHDTAAKPQKAAKAHRADKPHTVTKPGKDGGQQKPDKDVKKHLDVQPVTGDSKGRADVADKAATGLSAGKAAAKPGARAFACAESAGVTVSAVWGDATVDDHQTTTLVATVSKGITCSTVSGMDFTITLPGGGALWRAQGSEVSTCSTTSIVTSPGSTALVVNGISMPDVQEDCTITFPVVAEASGSYSLTSAQYSNLTGLTTGQTTQTLTVTTAPARVGANISPYQIVVMDSSSLTVGLDRTDMNATAVSSGLGFRLNLPSGLTVGTGGSTGNTCGGTVTAAAGSTFFTLAGGSLTGAAANCSFTVPITSSIAGTYELDDTVIADPVGVAARMSGGCAESRRRHRTEGECGPSLRVRLKPQTIDFTAPADWSVSKGSVGLVASATSGLPVAFSSSTPSVCTVSGSTATLVAPGSCTVLADQAGDTTWAMATQVPRTFTVGAPIPAPSSVTATGGVSSISVSWVAPGDVTGVTGYTAFANPGPAKCTTTSAAATSCVMGGTAGVTYTVTVVTNNPLGDSSAAGPSNQATPTAPTIPATPPDTDLTLTTDQGIIKTAEPGQDIVVIGTGFMPYSTATIVVYSQPIELGTAVTDGQGNFSKPVRVPPDLVVGAHSLVAAGVGPNGLPHSLKMAITVAAAGGGGGLAVTGAPIAAMLQLGLATVFGGGGLLFASRRRKA